MQSNQNLIQRRRGTVLESTDTYVDISDSKSRLILNSDRIISLSNPIGLYQSIDNPENYVFIIFNAGHKDEDVYIRDPNIRYTYTKTPYVTSKVVGWKPVIRTYSFRQFTELCVKWDSRIVFKNYKSQGVVNMHGQHTRKYTFDLEYEDKVYDIDMNTFIEILHGTSFRFPSDLSFESISFKMINRESGSELAIALKTQPDPWDLGLNDGNVIFTIAYLITKRLHRSNRTNVVKVSRFCSEFISYVKGGNQGLIEGLWLETSTTSQASTTSETLITSQTSTTSETLTGSIPPTSWKSTGHILSIYREINGGIIPTDSGLFNDVPKAVKYGQCFIFACLMQSFMRACGIPCRAVRTEDSAHDSIRSYIIACREGDSVPCWNFHVWNEVWFSRADLNNKYREPGWQVIDATPQGISYDCDKPQMACGPCPVEAIRDLQDETLYDAKFIIGEVNAVMATYIFRPVVYSSYGKHDELFPQREEEDDWYIYDVGYGRTATKIMIETYGSKKITYNGYDVYDLTESKSNYVNFQIDPRSCITGNRRYKYSVNMMASIPTKYKCKVNLECSNPRLYTIAAILSLDRYDGPLESNEIDKNNVIVRKLHMIDMTQGSSEYNFIFNYDLNKEHITLIPTCLRQDNKICSITRTSNHSDDCAVYPTIRFFIKLALATQLVDSQASIAIYQWSGNKWNRKLGL